jgi:DNA replication protein DnaC
MKRFFNATFEHILTIPRENAANARYCREYAKEVRTHIKKDGIGLILTGGYGTMKTTLAVAILQETLKQGFGGVFVPMCSLIDDLFTMRSLNREEWARYERRIRNTSLLVLDDFGSESTDQGWVLSKLDSILTERYNKMLPVIITTNYTMQDMEGTYSGRLMDRLRSTNRVIEFTGKSKRIQVV